MNDAPPVIESAPPVLPVEVQSPPTTLAESRPSAPSFFWRAAIAAWKFAVGILLCQSLLLSVAVVGWTQRLMQRVVYKRWWKQSPLRHGNVSFDEFASGITELTGHTHWPNWIVRQNFRQTARGDVLKSLVHSLWLNARLGVQAIFNTWVLTMPGCVAMLFSWAYGWNNSFNKGYEHAAIGPGLGLFGLALFIAAMLYVPMAQAYQAASGNWRAFYQWRIVWRVVRTRWLACLWLAAVYSLISVPVMAQRVVPSFLPQIKKLSEEQIAALTPQQIEHDLNRYFLGASIVVLIGFVVVRWLAARIYAGGILRALRRGDVPAYSLAPAQHVALDKLGYLNQPPEVPRHIVLDVAGRAASLAMRFAGAFAVLFLWFTFVAQIYISQFLNYVPVVGWLNQPLVQLPWVRYVPHKINGEFGLALAVIGIKSAVKQLRPTSSTPRPEATL
jgi:hypothetical protein